MAKSHPPPSYSLHLSSCFSRSEQCWVTWLGTRRYSLNSNVDGLCSFFLQTCPWCRQSSLMLLIKLWGNEVAESAVKYVWPLLINPGLEKVDFSARVCSLKTPSNSAGVKAEKKSQAHQWKKIQASAVPSETSQRVLTDYRHRLVGSEYCILNILQWWLSQSYNGALEKLENILK